MKLFDFIRSRAKEKFYEKQVFTEENEYLFSDCQILSVENADAPFVDFVTLSTFLDISPQELAEIKYINPNKLYKTFYIDKRTHKVVPKDFPGKLREINAPIEELKKMQKKLMPVFSKFPIHPANNGFVSGKSIYDAALAVKDGETLIHIDINKFFDNHEYDYVKTKLKEKFLETYKVELNDYTLTALLSLITLNSCLPQGAPTSPCLVVALNYEMDENIAKLANEYNLTYSRYADDLAFSGSIDFAESKAFIKELSRVLSPFTINWEKLKIMRTSSKGILTSVQFKKDIPFTKEELAAIKKDTSELFGEADLKQVKEGLYRAVSVSMDKLERNDVEDKLNMLRHSLSSISGLVVKPKFYYIQSTKHLLGMNIVDGKINYPRRDYENLRVISMLLGRQILLQNMLESVLKETALFKEIFEEKYTYRRNNMKEKFINLITIFSKNNPLAKESYRNLIEDPLDIMHFKGILSHIHLVDITKEQKLQEIIANSYSKCYSQMQKFLAEMDHSGFEDCFIRLVPKTLKW